MISMLMFASKTFLTTTGRRQTTALPSLTRKLQTNNLTRILEIFICLTGITTAGCYSTNRSMYFFVCFVAIAEIENLMNDWFCCLFETHHCRLTTASCRTASLWCSTTRGSGSALPSPRYTASRPGRRSLCGTATTWTTAQTGTSPPGRKVDRVSTIRI